MNKIQLHAVACLGAALFLSFATVAQQSDQFNSTSYQAIAREAGGAALANQSINVRFTIFSGLSVAYEETQLVTTNSLGLFTTEIGAGAPTGSSIAPSYEDIDWGGALGAWSLEVAIDPTGGNSFVSLGPPRQMRSVPFANLAQRAEVLGDSAWVPGPGVVVTDMEVGIGTAQPDTTLHVVGKMKYQDGTEGVNKVLTSDADGNASWSGVSHTYGEYVLPSNVNFNPISTFIPIPGFGIQLPSAGTYQVTRTISVLISNAFSMGLISVFYDTVSGIVFPNSESLHFYNGQSLSMETSATMVSYYTVTGPTYIEVRARNFGQAITIRSDAIGRTKISFLKVGD